MKLFFLILSAMLLTSCTKTVDPQVSNKLSETPFVMPIEKSSTSTNTSPVLNDILPKIIEPVSSNSSVAIKEIEVNKQPQKHVSSDTTSEAYETNSEKTTDTKSNQNQNSNHIAEENSKKTSEPPKVDTPPEPLCPHALFDKNQPCDWIHPNLIPIDELGRQVPTFSTSQEAWNWADAQIYNETSPWFMCGFNRMDGQTNDGSIFYYAYMKSCP